MQSVFGSSNSQFGIAYSSGKLSSHKQETAPDVKALLKGYASNVMKDVTVVETRKFAGQEIKYAYEYL